MDKITDRRLAAFNYTRNRDKLFANLINIIEGITCDSKVDEKELLFLDTWLLESEAIRENYCVQVIRDKIAAIMEDGVIEEHELSKFKDDLIDIQKNLQDLPDIDLFSTESDKHLLEGLCKGVLANQFLSDTEIKYLNWFLSVNSALKNNYPGKELYSLVKDILDDGVITEDERNLLKKALIDFSGCDLDNGIVDGAATRLPVQDVEHVDFKNKTVCLTGKFLYGNRRQCEEKIESLGGIVVDKVTQTLDYLIIGTLSSRDWRYQSYGRKIELAIEYRDIKQLAIKIISEEQIGYIF